MITVQMKTRVFGVMYQKTYPTELQDHIRQHEFYTKVDALNKPLKANAMRLAWIGLAGLLLSGGFITIFLILSRHNEEIMLYIAIILFFMTKLVVCYVAVIWYLEIDEERVRIIREFNSSDRQRGIKWKCISGPFWPFCIRRSSILIELDAPLRNEKANMLTKSQTF
ncbi:7341_t:CDS:2 [Paraglomus brasilianum]|uniref:7341_t:CDS:1 n=1 Tax=Paraglomus brasilianum TaxID=144538 RepID=A0A9N9AEI3_9GLOM|nr:7341_t:CDS:2 [Paraglomus brasilianum]